MKYLYLLLCTLLGFDTMAQTGQSIEFTQIRQELQKKWPDNRTVNLVFHGHSVPSGYANTPNVKTLQAYPHQVLEAVKEIYPYAVVNSITTSIGGENAEQGAKRFKQEPWSNQTLSLFAFLGISVWMFENSKAKWVWIPLIPAAWYTFVTVTYIANAQIGFHIPWTPAYIIGVCAAVAYVGIVVWYGKKRAARLQKL